jgi:hypothetical protein
VLVFKIDMTNINTWAKKVTSDIYNFYKKEFPTWKYGIKTFYSPVNERPPLAIISYQPGEGEQRYAKEDKVPFEKGNFRPPMSNVYIDENNKMAKKIKDLFDFDGLETLKKSVVFPLIFFRAPSVKIWKKESGKEDRNKIETFCFDKVKEIIERIRPKKILLLGTSTTYEEFKKINPLQNEQILHTRGKRKERMFIIADYKECKIFAIIHPTGARISSKDWDELKKLVKKNLS